MTDQGAPRLSTAEHLTTEQTAAVLALVAAATEVDGVPPLGEHVLLHLRHGGGGVHVLAHGSDDGRLLGYAHVDTADLADGPAVELAVGPWARGRGVGTALLDEALARCAGRPGTIRLWAHGRDAAAGRLAAAGGFLQVRHLWQMRRSLHAPLPPVALPPGIAVRAFDPHTDVADVLAVNGAAFRALPDQAGWTEEDLRRRMAERWFDPSGFLLAHAGDELVGFHWTKVHGGHPHSHAATGAAASAPTGHHDALGEVYVLAVHPSAQGRGLGRALTVAGLAHLRAEGLPAALLYVDGQNGPAIRLYACLGFTVWDSDTLYRRPPVHDPSGSGGSHDRHRR